jgi:MULE transposase domain
VLIDGTFETNRLGLVLLVAVGVTNTGKNFPAAYSFARSEARVSFDFVFDYLKRFILTDDVAEAGIVLGDQAPGLIASMPESMPNCKLQHCGWHIAQNIKKRLAEKRYLAEERKAIMNLVWFYIQSSTEAELVENRASLMASVKASEQNYIAEHWCPRERQFVYFFTRKDPNLGCNSTQRAESTHPVTTTLLNHQLTLQEASTRLAKGIRMLLRDLDEEESKSYGPALRTLDLRAFSSLIGQVTEYAMNRIADDWEACKQAVNAGTHEELALEDCDCELLLRFSLPCKHHLLRACVAGTPIPRSLFHPRWWLNGPIISKTFTPWKPHYHDSAPALPISQRLNDITTTGLQVLTARDGLTGLAKTRFDSQLIKTNKALLEFAGQVAQDDLLPTRLPDKVKKSKWAKPRKPHGKASARSYTGAEAAELELAADQAERSSKTAGKQVARPDTPENSTEEGFIIPGTPPRAGESQGGTTITLVIRTPERLRGPPDLVPRVISSPEATPEAEVQPPASTAPGRIEIGEGKRRRTANKLYTNSQYEL